MSVVLVTGGSSGIGFATVQRLAAAGHEVFAASRNPSRAPLPSGVTPIVLDLIDPVSCRDAVGAVVTAADRLDVLVNNAGSGDQGPLEESADEHVREIFEVNVFGPMRLARAALPVMRSHRGGRIVNVTSMNDVCPAPFGGWYSASKAALASASAVLDAEAHGFGIRVTVVAPGLFRTAMAEKLVSYDIAGDSPYAAAFEGLREQTFTRLETAGDPDDVAVAIENCIKADEPPARIVVGADAAALEKLIQETSPDDFARLLRAFVAGLTEQSAPPDAG